MRKHPYDKLKDHGNPKKGILRSPINQMGNITHYSWMKECFPDFIWIALIIDFYGRRSAFTILSFIFKDVKKLSFEFESLQLSYIFSLENEKQEEFYEILLKHINSEILNPLTIIFNNNDNELFFKYFYKEGMSVEEKLKILESVMDNYGHNKSDGATDVQYVILTFCITIRQIIRFTKDVKPAVDALYYYQKTNHEEWEMRIYRPTVRSMFGSLQYMIYEHDSVFMKLFWKELLEVGDCKLKYGRYENEYLMDENFIEDIKVEFQKLIIDNMHSEIEDSKFNVIIGSSVYALKILNELVECNLRNKVMGRLSLRIIIEIYIMLKFINNKEDEKPGLWEEYQEYGTGKYKLILIKAREIDEFENSHLNRELLDFLVNEQIDEMFQNVDFRNFENKTNIRDKAIKVNEKELFDVYYDYESSYAHGLWGAVRESSMLKCDNPLHLGHNVPDVHLNKNLADVLPDAIRVFKKLLCFINENYPLSEEFVSKYEVKNE